MEKKKLPFLWNPLHGAERVSRANKTCDDFNNYSEMRKRQNNSFNVGGIEQKTKILTFDSRVIIIHKTQDSKKAVDIKVVIVISLVFFILTGFLWDAWWENIQRGSSYVERLF